MRTNRSARSWPSRRNEAPELAASRRRLSLLKEELKARHEERNQLRRELDHARSKLAARDAAAAKNSDGRVDEEDAREEHEGLLLASGDVAESQPLRIPVFSAGYARSTDRIPLHVRKAALQMVGKMASGDPASFKGARRLEIDRLVVRQKVHRDYRLLCRLESDRMLVLDLIPRAELERRIQTL